MSPVATEPTTFVPVPPTLPIPSAARTVADARVAGYRPLRANEPAAVGHVVVGRVRSVGEHTEVQNVSGRAHQIAPGTIGLFTFGNRYATDAFEALVPEVIPGQIALVNKGGVVAEVHTANASVQTPTIVDVLGRAVDSDHRPVSTLDHPSVRRCSGPKTEPRADLVLVVGTSMNAGKSNAAVAVTRALTGTGRRVTASKVTGTASLKEILHVEDAGAAAVNDFTYLGCPSTYQLDTSDVIEIFHSLDHAIANRSGSTWVVEIADGIEQRETAVLLSDPDVTSRIHKLVFCAQEPLSVQGGITVLSERYGLAPDIIAGRVGGAPLGRREVAAAGIEIPVINSMDTVDDATLVEVLTT